MKRFQVRVITLSALLSWSLSSTSSQAFCQARSCDPDAAGAICSKDPVTGCSNTGLNLGRRNGCLTYGVARGGAARLGLTDAEFESIVGRAFALWTHIRCPSGSPPSLSVRSVGVVDAPAPFTCSEPSLNLDTWFIFALSPPSGSFLSGATAGITVPKFNPTTGEIIDADVSLNRLFFEAKLTDPNLRGLLATTATHEAGHVLGLAHSQDNSAVMYKSYELTPDRALSDDDISGICALYPPTSSIVCSDPGVTEAALNQEACDVVKRQLNATKGGGGVGGFPRETSNYGLFFDFLIAGFVCARRRICAAERTQL